MAQAVITAAIAPLYTQPSAQGERADEALCGMTVELLEQAGKFWHIRTHYGYEGFTPDSALSQTPALVKAWQTAEKKVVMQPYMDVQAIPKVQGAILQSVTKGALVSPVGELQGGWQRVRLCSGIEGWCWGAFLGEYKTTWSKENEQKLRKAFVNTALSYMGVQYRWGGKTTLGIDCSGLTFMAYFLNGVIIWRDAHMQDGYPMHEITLQKAKPGDLLFFPGHVAMLIGNDRYVHSTAGNNCHGVVINSLDPKAPDFRTDLPEKIIAVGSIF